MAKRFYTEEMIQLLLGKTPAPTLAERWGLTSRQVTCSRYKWRKKRGVLVQKRILTPEEEALIMADRPLKELAKELNLTLGEVNRIRYKIRHREPAPAPTVDDAIAQVKPLPF